MFPTMKSANFNMMPRAEPSAYTDGEAGVDSQEIGQNSNPNDSDGNDEQRRENQCRSFLNVSYQSPLLIHSPVTGQCESLSQTPATPKKPTGENGGQNLDNSCGSLSLNQDKDTNAFREALLAFFVVTILFVALWVWAL